ncbi:MAG: hypothetical protein Q9160_003812 [Pyrenula sp. 1 TL-2023]
MKDMRLNNSRIDSVGPSALAFPAFAQDHGYRNIDSGKNCAWQKGHNTDQSAFEWLACHPKQLEEFDRWMTVQRADSGSFLEVFPFNINELLARSSQHVLVDVGGGVGHQCQALLDMYPQFKGRVILQDLPHVLEHALGTDGVETMTWDFWSSEQPVKHASFYYMRNICHDFSDQACQTILNHVKRAIGPKSKILIDEIVLAENNVHWRATQLDMLMMTCLGTGERTLRRWTELLQSVGLEIEGVYQYSETMGDSVIVVVPAE